MRFYNFGSEMVQNCSQEKKYFFGLCHPLMMDLGHDQQQHPTVHSGGVSRGRVRCCGCWG